MLDSPKHPRTVLPKSVIIPGMRRLVFNEEFLEVEVNGRLLAAAKCLLAESLACLKSSVIAQLAALSC